MGQVIGWVPFQDSAPIIQLKVATQMSWAGCHEPVQLPPKQLCIIPTQSIVKPNWINQIGLVQHHTRLGGCSSQFKALIGWFGLFAWQLGGKLTCLGTFETSWECMTVFKIPIGVSLIFFIQQGFSITCGVEIQRLLSGEDQNPNKSKVILSF